MNYIMRTIYLDKKTIAELRTLSKRTRIPQAVFMREAVDIVLKRGMINKGDTVIITAGIPFTTPGKMNMMKVHVVE